MHDTPSYLPPLDADALTVQERQQLDHRRRLDDAHAAALLHGIIALRTAKRSCLEREPRACAAHGPNSS